MDDKKELLTLKEVCEVLGVSEKTFARDKIGAKLKAYKVGKRIKYSRKSIEALRIQ